MNSAIELQHVSRVYPGGTHALRDVSLQVAPAQLVVLMGPSGSGKTTLLNLVGALDTPTSGQVEVYGRNLATLSNAERTALRRTIGFIFQSFALLATATATENVEFGLRVANRGTPRQWSTQARQALTTVGLRAWADHRPGELSGGQQQRVAIARALAIEPQLILADEPTGDLDSQTGAQIIRLLRGYAQRTGAAIVVASHDPAVAEAADHVFRLRDGQLV